MKYVLLSVAILGFMAGCKQAQVTESIPTEETLFTIGNTEVPASEFRYLYKKNYQSSPEAFSEASLREYLELYIKFKLKVEEAKQLGLDTAKAFLTEYETYRKQLAQPYLTDREFSEQMVKDVYERLKQEVSAAHILVGVGADAAPEDTLSAYKKALEIREKAVGGESFEALAKQYSDDPSAKQNGGELGYFTALQMVYKFEDAAFTTPAGEISKPVRTRFGYHLVKVNDKRPSQGSVKVAHIMVRASEGMPVEDSIAAYNRIIEIKSRLDKGEDWGQLARQFSEDGSTKEKDGELPWFTTRDMPPTFAKASFSIGEKGEVTGPIKTAFGWHMIKMLDRKTLEPFEQLKPSLTQKIQRDSRSEVTQKRFLGKLKSENSYVLQKDVLVNLWSEFDTSFINGNWNFPSKPEFAQTLFSVGDTSFQVEDFLEFAKTNQRKQNNISVGGYARAMFDRFEREKLLEYEEAHLTTKYPEFKNLLKEYREGILLFEIMEQYVWDPAVKDSAGIAQFFDEKRGDYQWGERANATIFNASSAAILDTVDVYLAKGSFPVSSPGQVIIAFEKGESTIGNSYLNSLQPLANYLINNEEAEVRLSVERMDGENDMVVPQRLKAIKGFFKSLEIEASQLVEAEDGQMPLTDASYDGGGRVKASLFTKDVTYLERIINQQNALDLQVEKGWFEKGQKPLLEAQGWKAGTFRTQNDGRYFLLQVHEIQQPRPKELNETKGQVISDYQGYLEDEWVEKLRAKYPVRTNEKVLLKMVKKN